MWTAGTLLWLGGLAVVSAATDTERRDARAAAAAAAAGDWHEPNTAGPYFDLSLTDNVTVTAGRTALLRCRVFQLAKQPVSWIRKKDLHILTLGTFSYTTDERFKVVQEPEKNDFSLQITGVLTRDAGVYECQVNTEPKMSWPVSLNVLVPHATITGPADLYIQLDSNINLNCALHTPADPPVNLSWVKDGALLELAGPRAGISLQADRTSRGSTSYLVITRARHSDSGNYTCRPSEGHPATVRVHIIDDDAPAAMQTASSPPRLLGGSLLSALLVTVFCRVTR
ncbi:limbic system-associated membrane protein-like [Amphibalanus amphitrite]|uniref:limbic system-associated membrane protein-like n=1 Tax=Amphibalanus amphitrite TaxID=1232801 RepID=UPI001C91532D|nr:limbic system-associated membrane protein-like [Amphibalanus amphitrite]